MFLTTIKLPCIHCHIFIVYIAINISFSMPSYTVKESLGQVQLELVLTGSYSDAITVRVKSRDITATG